MKAKTRLARRNGKNAKITQKTLCPMSWSLLVAIERDGMNASRA
jgi:hypothetical protein